MHRAIDEREWEMSYFDVDTCIVVIMLPSDKHYGWLEKNRPSHEAVTQIDLNIKFVFV